MRVGDQDEFVQNYLKELTALQEEAHAFSEKFPALASNLRMGANERPHPEIQRLIESVAFLAARVQTQIQADLPEVSANLIEFLLPQCIRSLPSVSVARFTWDTGRAPQKGGSLLPKGTTLVAPYAEGKSCKFQTTADLQLTPLEVAEWGFVHPHSRRLPNVTLPSFSGVLSIRLRMSTGRFSSLRNPNLKFFLQGPTHLASNLYDLIFEHAKGILLQNPQQPDLGVFLPIENLKPFGMQNEDGLLPGSPYAEPGLDILYDYLAFPETLLSFEVHGIDSLNWETELDLFILLEQPPSQNISSREISILTNCVSCVNLFPKISDPIRLDRTKLEAVVYADAQRRDSVHLYSVESVQVIHPETKERKELAPLIGWDEGKTTSSYPMWFVRRTQSATFGDELLRISLTAWESSWFDHAVTLVARVHCTNGSLVQGLGAKSTLYIERETLASKAQFLFQPTPFRQVRNKGRELWDLLGLLQTRVNPVHQGDGEFLLAALRRTLHFLGKQIEGKSGRFQNLQHALVSLERKPVVRRIGYEAWKGFVRGFEFTLTLDETFLEGSSRVLLAGMVRRYLQCRLDINSFADLVILHKGDRNFKMTWRWDTHHE
jgi:type VI secretion system protein ImpG